MPLAKGREQRLTATVTATAATNGRQRRSATARNPRAIGANLGYARPEKQKVGGSIPPLNQQL
jgi:hypothetical protein